MKFRIAPGAMPIDPDEAAGLIPARLLLQQEFDESDYAPLLDFLRVTKPT